MKQEIFSAVSFVSGLLRHQKTLTPDEVDQFSRSLFDVLMTRYSNHWFPEHPFKGSAFRCIRIVKCHLDPVVVSAATQAGIAESKLVRCMPSELTLWIDPNEVSYRFGEDGSIGVVECPAPRDIYDNCRNEHLKHTTEFTDVMSTAIAV